MTLSTTRDRYSARPAGKTTRAAKAHQIRRFARQADADAYLQAVDRVVPMLVDVLDAPAASFHDYYRDAAADDVSLYVVEDGAGEVVGAVSYKYYRFDFDGAVYNVARIGIALRREARGQGMTVKTARREFPRVVARGRMRRLHVFATQIHPRAYRSAMNIGGVLPNPTTPMSPIQHALLTRLIEHNGLEVPDPERPYSVREKYRVQPGQCDDRSWDASTDPAVRFFLDQCPDYRDGRALAILVPINPAYGFRLITNRLRRVVRRLRRR